MRAAVRSCAEWPVVVAPLAPSGDDHAAEADHTAQHVGTPTRHPPIGMSLLVLSAMTTTLESKPAAQGGACAATAAATGVRLHIDARVHKGLRMFMADTLTCVARLDLDDRAELSATRGPLGELLDACRSHLGGLDRACGNVHRVALAGAGHAPCRARRDARRDGPANAA